VIVVLVAAAPPLLARYAEAKRPEPSAGADPKLATAVIDVPGIDCAACVAPMRNVLAKVGGFRDLKLDIPRQTVAVTYEPSPGRLVAYVAAINGLGYEARLRNGTEAPP
jgi:copper chaperone CopZ